MKQIKAALYLFFVSTLTTSFSQGSEDTFYNMSLEELLNVNIYSVSKKAESFAEAPLSSSVITKDELLASGATTIEEVFRLIPGMIVREETNGNFDVHIRGFDNTPPGSYAYNTKNVSTLVMIDGRRVYNSLNAGTFWENLPVSLADIDRIEVIRGPSQALYGPNAATGVINIITNRKNEYNDVEASGTLMGGSTNSIIANASAGVRASDAITLRGSVNYDKRDRSQSTYYHYVTQQYVPKDQLSDYNNLSDASLVNPLEPITDADVHFPNEALSKEKYGANFYGIYEKNDIEIATTFSYQDATVQAIFNESSETPISTREADSYAVDLRASLYGFTGQFSYLNGSQNAQLGQIFVWDYTTVDATLEYDFFRGNDNLSIRPGFQYQRNHFEEYDYISETNLSILGGESQIENGAYFVKVDYSPLENLRIITALRNDFYNNPDDDYLSYQFATTYKLAENSIVRAVASRSYRGSTISQFSLAIPDATPLPTFGDPNSKLMKVDLYEVGFRNTIGSNIQTNVEVFYSEASDFGDFSAMLNESFAPELRWQNFPTVAKQKGVTIDVNYVPSSKFNIGVFGTFQSTNLENDLRAVVDTLNPFGFSYEEYDTKHERTPSFYGGAKLTWRPVDKMTVFSNVYFYGANNWVYQTRATLLTLDNVAEVESKARVDMKVSYNVFGESNVFFNARNLFNNTAQEFGWTDEIGGLYLIGIDLKL